MPKKFLIIRFSSIGDIIQCMTVVDGILNHYPDAEIHWIARKDMSSFLAMDQRIHKVWGFDRKKGFKGLLAQAKQLKAEKFDFVYDAHSNIRSIVLKTVLVPRWKRWFGIGPKFTMRSKDRIKRILLFKFRIDRFPMPFKGMRSFRKPMEKWGIDDYSKVNTNWFFPEELKEKMDANVFSSLKGDKSKLVTLVPSAAWIMKRWPVSHWQKLVSLLPDYNFMILAGPDDVFCSEIEKEAPEKILNLAGKTNLLESCYLTQKSNLVISGDTGFLHAADKFNVKALSLMGPTAFGFTTGDQIKTLEVDMKCRPCSKDGSGKCKMNIYQQCMVDITPEWLAKEVKSAMI
ncbi:glycosyltransferase family 9 protein [Marinifilum sp. N1E240]|uniref:glycosyltransferase family 9 protein n=1 Tax=Marinifilum sp. N1E240 TaxID=2608082 RepID=UPI00128C42BA|nr:glycosyltransferase family 9 protein [Marinifilum sp. N1E240]MPQ48577.1 glycosyltransferase family 9 protein [Marinifilum sp. N1E240]